MSQLEVKNLGLSYGDAYVFENLSLAIPKGKITVLIGSNGSGKSTLLRAMARLLKPHQGSVILDGADLFSLTTKQVARKLSILPQGPVAPEGLTVLQLVKQGRYPYQSWLKQWSEEDEAAVHKALVSTGMDALADRPVDSLSGGQRQRAWIAMTLAQETGVILLDEPTTYLDVAHQIEILDLLYELNTTERRTIVMVLHDINLACRYADHVVAVCGGRVEAQGKPADIIDSKLMETVFAMECEVIADPFYGTPLCIPHSKGWKGLRNLAVSEGYSRTLPIS